MDITILLLAVSLSMDAFAVSVTNGMCYRMPLFKNALFSGLTFGIFQGLMPLLGFFAGQSFSHIVERYDHWIALFLLGFIGARMVHEAVKEMRQPAETPVERVFSFKVLMLQGIATSIDALAVGVSLGVMQVNVFAAVSAIGVTTFLFSFGGVLIGKKSGSLLKEKAELLGGVILIIIGVKIFAEHMFL